MAAAVFRFSCLALAVAGLAACTGVQFTDRSMIGTWRVTAVNGQPTPAGEYEMQFADRRLSAHFGCNFISGAYIVEGDELRIDGLTATLKGCPEPSATIERDAFQVLQDDMKITAAGSKALRFDSASGSIEIRR
ncbi:MAG TPA: META domain-containing protein [Sphingomicrobium sp.]|nr:META domain-containing protein [Sphingomicrobium sp.]